MKTKFTIMLIKLKEIKLNSKRTGTKKLRNHEKNLNKISQQEQSQNHICNYQPKYEISR